MSKELDANEAFIEDTVRPPVYRPLPSETLPKFADLVNTSALCDWAIGTPIIAFYTIMAPGLGILLMSLVMRRGNTFSKVTSYVGIGAGILSVTSVLGVLISQALGFAVIPGSILTLLWSLFAGLRLYRMSRA